MPLRERTRQRGGLSTSPRANRRAAPTSEAMIPVGAAIRSLPIRSASRSSAPALICSTPSSGPTMITAGPGVAGAGAEATRESRPLRTPTAICSDSDAISATSSRSKPWSEASRNRAAPPQTWPRSRNSTRSSSV